MQHAALMLFGTTSADYRDGGWPPQNKKKCLAPEVSTSFFLIVMDSSPFDKPISIGDWSGGRVGCTLGRLVWGGMQWVLGWISG